MTKRKDIDWSGCPIRYAVGIFGDKWSLLIIRDLMFKDRRYYSEFLKAGEGISTNILADRLEKLENAQVIARTRDPKNGSKLVYFLTDKGLALMPSMLAMMAWSREYDSETEVPAEFAKALKEDRAGLEKNLRQQIEDQMRRVLPDNFMVTE